MSDRVGVLNSYHLGEVLRPSARKLGERCGAAAVDMLACRLTDYIGSAEDDKYSYMWRSAIESHEQDAHKNDARAVLVAAVRDAALGATSTSSPAALAIVKSLLQSPYPTLTRVGIYVCGEHYGTVGTAFGNAQGITGLSTFPTGTNSIGSSTRPSPDSPLLRELNSWDS